MNPNQDEIPLPTLTRHRVLPTPPEFTAVRVEETADGQLNLTAQIPFQFAQAMMAFGSAIFSSQLKTPERVVQVTQGVISAARLALSIALIAEDELCMDNKKSALCKSVLIFSLLYIGVLSVAATVAASSQKSPSATQATAPGV